MKKKNRNYAEMVWNAVSVIGIIVSIVLMMTLIFIDVPGWMVFTALFLMMAPMFYGFYNNYMEKKRDRLRIHKRK